MVYVAGIPLAIYFLLNNDHAKTQLAALEEHFGESKDRDDEGTSTQKSEKDALNRTKLSKDTLAFQQTYSFLYDGYRSMTWLR